MQLESVLKIVNYGKYSKPFIYYLLEYSNDTELKRYLRISKAKWVVKNQNLLKKIDAELKNCNNVGIKHLILSTKLSVVRVLKYQQANRKLYHKLIKEFGNIPLSCRGIIGKTLKMNEAYNHDHNFKEFRTWSQRHMKDNVDIALELNAKAIKFARKKEYKKAAIVYYCVYQNALKYPHPTYITAGLNNAAWYRKFSNLERAVKDSEELAYYLGYYLEYSTAILGYLDTILVVSRENDDYASFYKVSKILNFYYEALTKNIPEKREKYKKTMLNARKCCLVQKKKGVKRDEVSTSKTLQKFLNQKIDKPRLFAKEKGIPHVSLYRVLKGEKETVKIKTLMQIVQALELELSFENPREINYILLCIKEDQQFFLNCEKLKDFSISEIKQLLLRGVFVQLPDESVDYLKLFSLAEDIEKLIKYVGADYSRKEFINACFEPEHFYYKGRTDLFNILVEAVGDERALSKLVNLYATVKKNEHIEILNIYFREYARYSNTQWDFDVAEVLENRFSDPDYERVIAFCRKLNLSELYGYLCTWYFDGKERYRLIEIL
jgi:hypothetical protein